MWRAHTAVYDVNGPPRHSPTREARCGAQGKGGDGDGAPTINRHNAHQSRGEPAHRGAQAGPRLRLRRAHDALRAAGPRCGARAWGGGPDGDPRAGSLVLSGALCHNVTQCAGCGRVQSPASCPEGWVPVEAGAGWLDGDRALYYPTALLMRCVPCYRKAYPGDGEARDPDDGRGGCRGPEPDRSAADARRSGRPRAPRPRGGTRARAGRLVTRPSKGRVPAASPRRMSQTSSSPRQVPPSPSRSRQTSPIRTA